MKILNVILFICIPGVMLIAQEKKNYSGKIVDAETKQPIELVAVYTNSASTISNTDGEYELECEVVENITFSHLNYYAQNINCQHLPDVIELKPKIFELAEVIVISQEAVVRELKGVWSHYNQLFKGKKEKDFPESTYYYRQLTLNNDTCIEYIESFFTATTSILLKSFYLQEGRYGRVKRDSTDVTFWFTNYYHFSRLSPVSLEKAKTKTINAFLCKDFERYYDVSINRIISPDQSDEITVYEFQPKGANMIKNSVFLSGLLYVKTKDRVIVQAEMYSDALGLTLPDGISHLKENNKFVISYREVPSSFPVIESVKLKSSIDVKVNGQIHNMAIQSTLIPAKSTFEKKGKRIKFQDNLFHKLLTSEYNQAFWDENPVVKRTKIEQQILDDFNREGYFGTLNLENNNL